MKRIRKSQVVIIAAALLLAGCKFQAFTRVDPGGSGELRTEVGFSAQERENLEKQNEGTPPDDFCNTAGASAGTTVTEEQRGDETWCVTNTPFDSLDELQSLYEQRQGLLVKRLEIQEGTLYYEIEIDTASDSSSFSGFEAITWSLTLPGALISHNADTINGNELTWSIAPRSGIVSLQAQSEAPAREIPALWVLLVGGAVLLVIGFALRGLLRPLEPKS